MRIYEELFIVDPNTAEEQVDAVVSQIENVITGAGGQIDKVEKWGIRRLAYRVKKRDEGFYVLVQFSAEPNTVRELERRLRVDEVVIKYLTVRIDEDLKWIARRKAKREARAARRPKSAPPMPAAPAQPAPAHVEHAAAPGQPEEQN